MVAGRRETGIHRTKGTVQRSTYRFSLNIARADGSGIEAVWDGFEGLEDTQVAWSPDGSQIAISIPAQAIYVIECNR